MSRSASLGRVRAMVRKETWHILRDWQTLLIVLVMPLAMMFLYGYALTLDVKDARIVVEMPTQSLEARRVVSTLDATTVFAVAAVVRPGDDPTTVLKRHHAKALVKLPPGFAAGLRAGGSPATVQVVIDGSDQNVGTILANALQPVLRNAVLDILHITPPEPVAVRPLVLYNPEQKTALFLVPGLMAVLLIMVSALLTALAITREKELGTMEQLLVSPIRPWEVIAGKILPYVVIAAADALLIVLAGRVFFGVGIRGSAWFLAASGLVYITTALAIGLTVSTAAKNQTQAMLMVLPPTMMPTVVLSGFIFPLASFPIWLKIIAHIIPATYFLQIIRGVMLKGVGLAELWRPLACLGAIGILFLAISIRNFRTRL